jgi:hypothetical protein
MVVWLIASSLLCSSTIIVGQTATSTPASMTPTPTPEAIPSATAEPPFGGDSFGPGAILFVVFIFFIVVVVVIVVGVVLGLALLALIMLLVAVGIISSSVLIGFLRRRPGSAITALFVQVGAVAGMPFGVAGFWIVKSLMDLQLSSYLVVLGGAICGLVSGVIVGLLFSLVCKRVYRWSADRLRTS